MASPIADWATLATALEHFNAKRLAEAGTICRAILERAPDDFWTLRLLSWVHIRQAEFEPARLVLEKAWAVGPPDEAAAASTLADLATMNVIRRDYATALELAQAALAHKPDDVIALQNSAIALLSLSHPEEALKQYRAALAVRPDAETRYNEGYVLLSMGDWQAGWSRFEARLDLPDIFDWNAFAESLPRWRGDTDISGRTLLLQAEQGLGDTLQFLRFIPLLAARGPRIVLRVQPPLGNLLQGYPGVDRVVTDHDEPSDVELHCRLMSLPAIFGITLENLPATVPYVHPRLEYLLLWQALLGERRRPRVGIAWSGRQHLPLRSMPLPALGPLLQRDDLEFHVLQNEILEADRDWLAAHPALHDHSRELKDFNDTAALIAQMDLVITIDTSIAHLSGALAKPTWIMLPFSADAKWLLQRSDTPWYPTARLFRQKRLRDWDSVVTAVLKALS